MPLEWDHGNLPARRELRQHIEPSGCRFNQQQGATRAHNGKILGKGIHAYGMSPLVPGASSSGSAAIGLVSSGPVVPADAPAAS
jgi:hypothetical protein